MRKMLTIALPKGRILTEANQLFKRVGLIEEEIIEGRKLVIERPEENLGIILAKPQDVPTYVKYGVTDLGIVGKDILMEANESIYELMDLKIGSCRLSLCGLEGRELPRGEMLRIATKYPDITAKYFLQKGQQVEIIKLNGSVELAPLLGLSDFIIDIVSTGKTLKENGLLELEVIFDNITSRLIANESSYHIKTKVIDAFVNKLEEGVK
jgi:ATP phosphoribosyltransferase